MSKFFRKLCCCGAAGASSPVEVRSSGTAVADSNRNRPSVHVQQVPIGNQERRRNSQQPKIIRKFLKIKSSYSVDTAADTRSKELKFNCPICFRFFDHIMITTCCHNYLCHHCAADLNEKVMKDDKTPIARCPFCQTDDFELYDVDTHEKPKKYTDSFYSSIKSNGGIFGKENFTNKLFMKNRDQLYDTNGPVEMDGSVTLGIEDKKFSSDGAIYMKKEIEAEKLSKSIGPEHREEEEDHIKIKEATRVIPGARIEYRQDDIRRRSIQTEERKSFDSLNDRDPIDVIKEDEFESSVVPVDISHHQHK